MNDTIARARELYLAGNLPAPDDITCVCGAGKLAHSGPKNGGNCPDGDGRYREDRLVAMAVTAALGAQRGLRADLAAYDRKTRTGPKKLPGQISVRPSDLGGCDRSVWYRNFADDIEGLVLAPSDRGPAIAGGIYHDEVMRRLKVIYPHRMFGDEPGMELYLPGFDRPCKYDMFDPVTGVLTSIKTAGRWQWEQVGIRGADEKWEDQDHLYAYALTEAGYTIDKIVVLVINRENFRDEPFEFAYDEARALVVLGRLQALKMSLELGIVPERGRSGPSTDGICRNCEFRNHCWSIPQAEALGKSPENLTILGVDPDVAVVAELGRNLIEVRGQKSAAERVEDELKALLDGVDLGVYQDVEAVEGWTSRVDYTSWKAEVEALYALPDGMRPAELPEPKQKNTRYVSWKKLRKATIARLAKEAKEREKARELEAAPEPQAPLTVTSERVGEAEVLALPPGATEPEQAAS